MTASAAEQTGQGSSALPGYPLPRECPYRPSSRTARLWARGPISRVRLYDGRTTWLVTGPAEARSLLADRRLSSRSDFPDYPVMDERHVRMRATREMAREAEGGLAGALFGMDPPEHTRQRQLLVPKFTVRQVATLQPEVERIVAEQLEGMLSQGPPADLVSAFAGPVPVRVVCAHLGVPYRDRDRFEPAVRGLFDPDRADAAMGELTAYLDGLVRDKHAEPGQGVIDDLVTAHMPTGEVSAAEVVAFASAILVAGTVTTSSVIALGTLALLDTPGQFAALCARPETVADAVEEMLRHLSVVEQLARVATEDIEIGGQVIRAGDGLLISFAAANLDPSVSSHPAELDITRPPTNHLAFSFGIHHCLGHNLARLQLQAAFRALAERIPTLRLATPVDQVPTYQDGDVTRLACLPVTW